MSLKHNLLFATFICIFLIFIKLFTFFVEVKAPDNDIIPIQTNNVIYIEKQLAPIQGQLPQINKQINGDFESAIRNRCAALGCNPDQVIRVMYCESGGRSNAYNRSGASGLFQFMPRTFSANAARVGIAGADIWNPWHQIDVATWMFAKGQSWQWVCK